LVLTFVFAFVFAFCLLFSYDPKVALDVNWLHETFRLLQSVVFRTEGTVRQFLVDDE
jgi:hypothetical protein